MAKNDRYRYIPLAVVIFCGFGLVLLCRYVAVKHGVDTGSSNLIFVFVLAGFILAYLLFWVFWESLLHKFWGKCCKQYNKKEKYKDYLRIVLVAYDKEIGFYEHCGFTVGEEKAPMFITSLWT